MLVCRPDKHSNNLLELLPIMLLPCAEYSCEARPPDCPTAPSVAPAEGCSCGSKDVCLEGWMCLADECVERPPACLPHPAVVAANLSCFCNLTGLTTSPQICQTGQLCHTTCLDPVFCPDPTAGQDWSSRGGRVEKSYNLTATPANTFIQWTWLEVECLEHRFTPEGEGGFRALCSEEDGGKWNLSTCSFPVCTEIQVEQDSVEVKELLVIDKANTQGAILQFSCKGEAEVFNVGSSLTRIQASCNRRQVTLHLTDD